RLGPEMKSTGEVMGTAGSFGKAYDKAQAATNEPIPTEGTMILDFADAEVPDPDSETGRELYDRFAERFEIEEFDDRSDAIRTGEVDLVVSRDRTTLETCVEEDVTYFSTTASAEAALDALAAREEDSAIAAVSERRKHREQWGASNRTAARK